MRAIVTGGCGFIGSHVVDLLVEKGHEVHVIDNLSTGDELNKNPRVKYLHRDILERTNLVNFVGSVQPHWVFHLAALPRIQPSFDDPETHDDVNVRGALNLLNAVRDYPVNALIYSSSSSAYGNPAVLPTPETADIDPLSPYALQKYAAERYLHILGERFRVPVASMRYFNVYGPRSFNPKNPFNAYTSVVGIFRQMRDSGQTIKITGDGSQERDFIHVRDVARANLFLAENIRKTSGNVYNVGTGSKLSILELAKFFGCAYEFIAERRGEARITQADISRLKELGWNPSIDLFNAIRIGDI